MKKFKLIAASLLASTMILAGCGENENPHEHTFAKEWTSDANYHWHEATCGHDVQGGKGEHSDGDHDHKCDVCEKVISTCVDNDLDNLCDICGADMPRVISVGITGAPEKLMETKSVSLKVNVQVKGNASKAVTWTASNSNATVDQDGVVTGVKAGSVRIFATSDADNTKIAFVDIQIVELYWTDEELDMFAQFLPEPIPFIKGSFSVQLLSDYGVVRLTSNDSADLATAKKVLSEAEGWEDLGSFTTEDGLTVFNYAKESAEYLGYETYVQAYSNASGVVTLDCAFDYIQYSSWPSEKIAEYATLIGFDGAEVKPFELIKGAYVNVAPEKLTSGEDIVYISLSDGSSYASDYADLYDENEFIVVYYDEEVTISPLDKSYTLYGYDTQTGFDIFLMDYLPDVRFGINEQNEMVAVNDTIQLTLLKGVDIDPAAPVTWSVVEGEVSVDQSGLVTVNGVGEGYAVVQAAISDEVYAQALIYTVAEIPTAFSDAQKAEFAKIHEGLGDYIPFNKYLDNVEYVEEGGYVEAYSSMYSAELENYYDALIADGWVDINAEQYGEEGSQVLYYYFGSPFMFEKEVVINDNHYWVSLELSCLNYYEDEETGETEYYNDYEGLLDIIVYDDNIYDYSEAMLQVYGIMEELGVETSAEFPENLPASRYFVQYYEEDEEMEEPECIAFGAYSVQANLAQIVSEFEAKGWYVETYHVDEEVDVETGDIYPAYDEIYALSEDGVIEMEGSYDGDLYLEMYFGEPAPVEEGVTFDYSEISTPVHTIGDFTVNAHKTGGEAAPVVQNNEELRVYSGNQVTISSEGDPITSIDFYNCDCTSKVGATLTADCGTLTKTDYGYHWEGEAYEVNFSCTKVDDNHKQCHFFSIEINGGGGYVPVGGDTAEDIISEICLYMFGDETAYESDGEGGYYTGVIWGDSSEYDLLSAIDEFVSYFLPESIVYELEEPAIGQWDDGSEGGFAEYCNEDCSVIVDVGTYEDGGKIILQVNVYDAE